MMHIIEIYRVRFMTVRKKDAIGNAPLPIWSNPLRSKRRKRDPTRMNIRIGLSSDVCIGKGRSLTK